MLMAQYNKLVAYLEEVEYHGDPELEAMVDTLGRECQEAEEETDDMNERVNGIHHFFREGEI